MVRAAELVDVAAVGLLLADTHGQLQFMAASDEQTRLSAPLTQNVGAGPPDRTSPPAAPRRARP